MTRNLGSTLTRTLDFVFFRARSASSTALLRRYRRFISSGCRVGEDEQLRQEVDPAHHLQTSQVLLDQRHAALGDRAVADTNLDRPVHDARNLFSNGGSTCIRKSSRRRLPQLTRKHVGEVV